MTTSIPGFSVRLRAVAAALLTGSVAVTPLVYAWPSSRPIVVAPANLPELARQPGQAMLLHDADDGRTLLYVEQAQGARLAIFDVTDPARIRSAGAVRLDGPGPFEFTSSYGSKGALVRFRGGTGDAWLDLKVAGDPVLRTASPLEEPRAPAPLSAAQSVAELASDRDATDDQPDSSTWAQQNNVLLDAGQIRARLTNRDTGTTFVLADSGLYVIRCPRAEHARVLREDAQRLLYSGG